MHGFIHTELKRYVETKHGADAWKAVLTAAGLGTKTYLTINTYPDEEALAIVKSASAITKAPADVILEDF